MSPGFFCVQLTGCVPQKKSAEPSLFQRFYTLLNAMPYISYRVLYLRMYHAPQTWEQPACGVILFLLKASAHLLLQFHCHGLNLHSSLCKIQSYIVMRAEQRTNVFFYLYPLPIRSVDGNRPL